MNFRGKAKRLDDIDLPKIGSLIRVGEDEIHAILDVEAAGTGFDKYGRPKMLFEPHIFYRQLSGSQRNRAVQLGLAYPKWKPNGYPADSYDRLDLAMTLNQTAALKSSSWGLPQILGFNHGLAGFETVQDMVKAFLDDEEVQLKAMVDFINASGLADELRRHDWLGFEKGYNGGGFKGAYAAKLKSRFDYWKKIKDTPWTPQATEKPVEAAPAPKPQPQPEAVPSQPALTAEESQAIDAAVSGLAPKQSFWSRLLSLFTRA